MLLYPTLSREARLSVGFRFHHRVLCYLNPARMNVGDGRDARATDRGTEVPPPPLPHGRGSLG